jgi:surface antigen
MHVMNKSTLLAAVAAGALALSGCATQQGQQEQVGMVVGGVLGGLLGTQVGGGRGTQAAIIAGTLAGAAIGGAVGQSMDETDRLKTAQTLETVRTGVSSQWQNPDTGNVFAVTPTSTFETASGPCREYTMEAVIGGRTEQIYGTACRTADGDWQIRN